MFILLPDEWKSNGCSAEVMVGMDGEATVLQGVSGRLDTGTIYMLANVLYTVDTKTKFNRSLRLGQLQNIHRRRDQHWPVSRL